MTINEKLTKIQVELKSKKSRFNSFGKYNFRSAEDILESIKPFLKDLKLTVTLEEKLLNFNPPVLETVATLFDGEQFMKANAIVGVEVEQKGMQMPQKFGSASSYGKKYALGNLFLIDDTQDSDASNTHGKKQKMTNESLSQAKEYIKTGGSVGAIESKYSLTPKQKQILETL